ncbi:MAG: DnaB-like helicase C-terminal domain-containing protein [Candidatus Cloacimonas sp.]|jgi:DNA primase|nr:DnaB-like helicase C-terminal domain-containing protein [Candidatus Cloacimonas sp.]
MNTDTLNKIHLQKVLDEFGYNRELKKSMKCLFPENHKHGDNKPSAGYKESKNTFYCQSCGASLNPVNFIMKELGCDVSGALKWGEEHFGNNSIEHNVNVTIPTSNEGDNTKGDNETMDEIKPNSKLYEMILKKGVLFEDDYRGIRKELLNELGIRKGFKNYLNTLPNKPNTIQALKDCGVVCENEKGIEWFILKGYDIIIPYYTNGKIVNLQGANSTYRKRKYFFLNGIERPLFNADIMKDMGQGETLWVVEGVFDCLSLLNMGEKAVGLPGSKGSFHKFKHLFQGFNIKTILDNDGEGGAGEQLGNEMIESGLNVQVFKWKGKRKEKFDINDLIQVKEIKTIRDVLDEVEEYGTKAYGFTDRLLRHKETMLRMKKGQLKGYRLNQFPSIESSIRGVQSKGVWLIGGRTNIGKTGFSVCVALDLVESNPDMKVIYICLDDTEGETINRMIAHIGEVFIWESDINTDIKDIESKKEMAYQTLSEYGKENRLDVVDIDTIGCDLKSILDYIKENKSEKTVVVIDGMNNIESNERESLRHDDKVGKELKRFTVTNNLSLIATCEIRKSAEGTRATTTDILNKKTITTDDIKGSVGLAYHANVISGCWAEDVDFSDPDKNEVEWNISFLKNKWGKGKGTLTMRYHKYWVKMNEKGWKGRKTKKEKEIEKVNDDILDINMDVDMDTLDELRKKAGI